ncbi:serine/threonine-protein phosphatase 7 long form [Dorcoceras hygrometricum]|uniref:Serine/threonine-protein phosphatase 7 long form n=1 Tax=Dorcoceras hygrometricum TaxID=472368 RepID=A0A2Z7D241_9LAMI|nr:serine/threonine-protein phosphatase 7 long form [Dorcoceras hygrometricum]
MDSVNVLIYYGGYVVADGRVGYSIPATRPMRISRSITFSQLIHDVQRMLTINPFKFHIKLSTKYSYNMMASYVEEHVHITDDDSLQFMLDLPTLGCLYLYVETLPIDDDVAHDYDPQSFIPIITQGFRTMVVDDEAGPSTYHGDRPFKL